MKKIKDKKTDASRRSFITKTMVGAGATAVTAFGQVKTAAADKSEAAKSEAGTIRIPGRVRASG